MARRFIVNDNDVKQLSDNEIIIYGPEVKHIQVLRYNISAEITHHINFYLSLLGTLFCLFKGMQGWWWMFGGVSFVLGLLADVPFMIIQRYNRYRVLPIYLRLKENANKNEIAK